MKNDTNDESNNIIIGNNENINAINGKIVESFGYSMLNFSVDSLIDLTEVNLDNLLTDSILKEIPVVKTLYNITNIGIAINNMFLCKKTINFIHQFNSNNITDKEYEKYRDKIKKNDKYVYKELEHIIIMIDKYVETNKCAILANLYCNYIEKKMIWEEFLELSLILNNVLISDFEELELIYEKKKIDAYDIKDKTKFNKLVYQGLIEKIDIYDRDKGNLNFYVDGNDYQITKLGILLYENGLRNYSN